MVGVAVAALSVVSSGMQQIFCRSMQQKHGLASHELLANTAPAQACARAFYIHSSASWQSSSMHLPSQALLQGAAAVLLKASTLALLAPGKGPCGWP